MKSERDLAELIFDKFREINCKDGQIVPYKTIQFTLIDKLNPKEKEIFFVVLNGLIFTGYYTYSKNALACIKLTKKGYDYIYDDNKIEIMKQKPWIIPDKYNTNWDKAYTKLWKIIGKQNDALYYIGGSQFFKFVLELTDDIPPSYSQYIEQRRNIDLSTSRVDYYKDLIDSLDEEKRFQLYVNIQLFIENETKTEKNKDFDFEDLDWNTPQNEIVQNIKSDSIEDKSIQEVLPVVFISYSWDDEAHQQWVLELANKLCKNGVDVILDRYYLKAGTEMIRFMENSVQKSDKVLLIMTPNFKTKADNRSGGVGYEYSMITAEMFNNQQTEKFIPILRSGTRENSTPTFVKSRIDIDMIVDDNFDAKFDELLRIIHEEPKIKKPFIGPKPTFN